MNTNRITRDAWAMQVAQATALRSTCLRRGVGCVLLNAQGHVLSTGVNGVAAGMPHCNDETGLTSFGCQPGHTYQTSTGQYPFACPGADSPSGTNLDCCLAIHAEQNALLQCRDVGTIIECFVTTSPCITCTKLLLNTGCRRIVFSEAYTQGDDAKKLWESAGREWLFMLPKNFRPG